MWLYVTETSLMAHYLGYDDRILIIRNGYNFLKMVCLINRNPNFAKSVEMIRYRRYNSTYVKLTENI